MSVSELTLRCHRYRRASHPRAVGAPRDVQPPPALVARVMTQLSQPRLPSCGSGGTVRFLFSLEELVPLRLDCADVGARSSVRVHRRHAALTGEGSRKRCLQRAPVRRRAGRPMEDWTRRGLCAARVPGRLSLGPRGGCRRAWPAQGGRSWVLEGVRSDEATRSAGARVAGQNAAGAGGPGHDCAGARIPIPLQARLRGGSWNKTSAARSSRSARTTSRLARSYLPAIARRPLPRARELGGPFNFLTWFEFAPENVRRLRPAGLVRLRETDEWRYVDPRGRVAFGGRARPPSAVCSCARSVSWRPEWGAPRGARSPRNDGLRPAARRRAPQDGTLARPALGALLGLQPKLAGGVPRGGVVPAAPALARRQAARFSRRAAARRRRHPGPDRDGHLDDEGQGVRLGRARARADRRRVQRHLSALRHAGARRRARARAAGQGRRPRDRPHARPRALPEPRLSDGGRRGPRRHLRLRVRLLRALLLFPGAEPPPHPGCTQDAVGKALGVEHLPTNGCP